MNLCALREKLVAVARSNPPSEQVPYAFEKRVMAGLAALPKVDEWAWWGRALWRGAAACAGVALLFSVWTVYSLPGKASTPNSADLEETVLSSAIEADLTW